VTHAVRLAYLSCALLAPALLLPVTTTACSENQRVPVVHDPVSPAADTPVILITGSTDGLGRELALHYGATGAHVIVHGRNRERGMEVVRAIDSEGSGSARFIAADLASLEEVRALAGIVLEEYDRLDLLINNAGIGPGTPGHTRVLTPDGHELRLQVNYLAGFLLTRLLAPLLIESAPSQIVNVASRRQEPIDFDDLRFDLDYSGGRAYGRSKLAQILFTFDLVEALEGTGVRAIAVHPAPAMDTELVRQAGGNPASTVDDGLDAVLRAIGYEGSEGPYFHEGDPARPHDDTFDPAVRERLRRVSEDLTGAPALPGTPAPAR
jgi:NAD(P)-dependent dehydrogenase (short-subunit alcohol dehydrogenase family)